MSTYQASSLYETAAANQQRRVLPSSARRANRMRILLNRVNSGRATAADNQELDRLTTESIARIKVQAAQKGSKLNGR